MITDVTTTPTTGTTTADSQMKQETGMNKDDFLKLFVTQLQNQDPLNPQDSSQFISQLAQITQVEQAYNTNTNLQSLLNQGGNNMTMASVSMIGKQVEAAGNQVSLQSGSPATVNFSLAQAAHDVTVQVQDSTGMTVKTITASSLAAGEGSVSWDGSTDSGSQASPGTYSFSVSAKDASGSGITATPLIKGRVDGVDMSGATPILNIGGLQLSLTNVTSVSAGA